MEKGINHCQLRLHPHECGRRKNWERKILCLERNIPFRELFSVNWHCREFNSETAKSFTSMHKDVVFFVLKKSACYSDNIRIHGEKLFYLSVLQNYHLAQATHETQVKLVKCKESCMDWKSKEQNETQGETLGLTLNNQRRHLAMLWIRAATTQMQGVRGPDRDCEVTFLKLGSKKKGDVVLWNTLRFSPLGIYSWEKKDSPRNCWQSYLMQMKGS